MVYDKEQKRLVVFGGFSNRWFNDVSVLNVARSAVSSFVSPHGVVMPCFSLVLPLTA